VTPTKKLLLAAAFVAAGYGVASQLGAPTLHKLGPPTQLADSAPRAVEPAAQSALPNYLTDARPRLVPEVEPNLPTIFDRDIEAAREPIGGESRSAFELASVSAPPLTLSTNPKVNSTGKSGFAPRAALRNEAPRPLVIEPRTPVNIKDVEPPPPISVSSAPGDGAPAAPIVTSPSTGLQAQYSYGEAVFGTTAPMSDTVAARAIPYIDSNPMPFAQILERDQVRSHIVVDGDSLAKLAERYLDDPQRASEIFELNRALLAHPDVLPIGAEITIPARSANTLQSANETPQSLRTAPAALHAAARGGLVPVRPVPLGTAVMPRAHLARPQSIAGSSVAGTLRVP
jgi:nucleoid-associated protein YgaU